MLALTDDAVQAVKEAPRLFGLSAAPGKLADGKTDASRPRALRE